MDEYRVVRADGTPIPHWDYFPTAEAARANLPIAGPAGPYRVQRVVWKDVPEPEPLPDLPTEVWIEQWRGGDMNAYINDVPRHPTSNIRVFRGMVTEWVEVTE